MTKQLMLFSLLLLTTAVAHADYITNVVVDTSALVGNPSGPFSIAFQFTDGSGTNDGNNTVTLSSFAFGGGAAGAVSSTFGNASGSLASSVVLQDTEFFNALLASFTPGVSLSFHLDMTTTADGVTPDEFSFMLLQGDLSTVQTTDPSGLDSLLTVDITGDSPSVSSYSPIGVSAVPEPSTAVLMCTSMVLLFGGTALRRRFAPRSSAVWSRAVTTALKPDPQKSH